MSPIEKNISFTREPWPRDQQAENYNIKHNTIQKHYTITQTIVKQLQTSVLSYIFKITDRDGAWSAKTKSRLPKFCGRTRDRKKWQVQGAEVVRTCFPIKKAILIARGLPYDGFINENGQWSHLQWDKCWSCLPRCYDLNVLVCFCLFIIFIISLILFIVLIIHSHILSVIMHSCSPVTSLVFLSDLSTPESVSSLFGHFRILGIFRMLPSHLVFRNPRYYTNLHSN